MPDKLLRCGAWITAGLVSTTFLLIVGDIAFTAAEHLSWSFLTTSPQDSGRSGGIGPILVSTCLILAVSALTAIPISLGTAILLAEFSGPKTRFGRWTRRSLDVLSAVPSIVFGLFGNSFFCVWLGMGFSILSGGLTLACMVLPILIRTCEAGIRSVSDDYRHAAAAAGLSRTTIIFRILLPAAIPALLAGLLLGIGRATAETAALIFTSGYVTRLPQSLFDSGRSLSVHIYDLSMNVAGGNAAACASAVVLIGLLVVTNSFASLVLNHWLHRRLIQP